jgi:hypothetical protein
MGEWTYGSEISSFIEGTEFLDSGAIARRILIHLLI